jgi:hypothetical protein
MDNPLTPQGVDDALVGFQGNTATTGNLFSITTTAGLAGKTLGLVVQFDTFGTGLQTYTLEQRVGSTAGALVTSVSSTALNNANDGYDWAFFTINGAAAGDFFVLTSTRSTAGRITYGQVAFDTVAIVPEPSVALLGGLGFLLLLRRRR